MLNLFATDAYKFSMAQAGFPLRTETFYLSFRKGGWQYLPEDYGEILRSLLPRAKVPTAEAVRLSDWGYDLTGAMQEAATRDIDIRAVPAGSWVYEREPILTVTGPSFLVSWLEAHALRLFYPIQLATEIKLRGREADPAIFRCTCEAQAEIARGVIRKIAPRDPELLDLIKVDSSTYRDTVLKAARDLISIVEDPNRIFEVGMRSVTCEAQHEIALRALQQLGINRTSNVSLALQLGMFPIGTMGHEHVQRWGDDLSAYRAMRDTRCSAPSYLLDTFHTITSGIPAVVQTMKEQPHLAAVRYDSGDKFGQYIYAHGEFQRQGLEPTHVIEDSLDASSTAKFERLRDHTGLAPEKQVYGYGGFLVASGWDNPLTRDRCAAVYKLCQTSGEPRMKWGNEFGLGKVSVPGDPVVWRKLRGSGPVSIIAQFGESVPEDYIVLNGNPESVEDVRLCNVQPHLQTNVPYTLSPDTERLVSKVKNGR